MFNVVLDVTDRQLTKYFVFDRYWRKNGSIMALHQLFIVFKKAYEEGVEVIARKFTHDQSGFFGFSDKCEMCQSCGRK